MVKQILLSPTTSWLTAQRLGGAVPCSITILCTVQMSPAFPKAGPWTMPSCPLSHLKVHPVLGCPATPCCAGKMLEGDINRGLLVHPPPPCTYSRMPSKGSPSPAKASPPAQGEEALWPAMNAVKPPLSSDGDLELGMWGWPCLHSCGRNIKLCKGCVASSILFPVSVNLQSPLIFFYHWWIYLLIC